RDALQREFAPPRARVSLPKVESPAVRTRQVSQGDLVRAREAASLPHLGAPAGDRQASPESNCTMHLPIDIAVEGASGAARPDIAVTCPGEMAVRVAGTPLQRAPGQSAPRAVALVGRNRRESPGRHSHRQPGSSRPALAPTPARPGIAGYGRESS